MDDNQSGVRASAVTSLQQGAELMEKLIAVAQPGIVFSEPVASGEYTVITASEVSVAMGFGFGIGGETKPEEPGRVVVDGDGIQSQKGQSFGGGGGGGGVSSGRPVAAISVGPNGIDIKPVFDPTKITIAALATLGGMLLMFGRMRRAGRS